MADMKRMIPAALAALTIGVAGCNVDAAGRGPAASVRDSAGISIIENASPDDSAAVAWWRLDGPELDIGGPEAEGEYALFQVTDALRLDNGTIVVSNRSSNDIRFFDSTGTFLHRTGGSGGGPGEYQGLTSLHRGPADSLLAYDSWVGHVSVLDPNGEYVRRLGGDAADIRGFRGGFTDGTLLSSRSMATSGEALNTGGVVRVPQLLVRLAADAGVMDTITEVAGAERIVQASGRSIAITTPPFGRTPAFVAHDDEVYVGDQDFPEIRVYGSDGTLRRIVRTGRATEPVTQAKLDALIERRVAAVPPEGQAEARASARDVEQQHGDVVPPYGTIDVDASRNLWVADFNDPTDPPGRWTIYDPDGAMLARIVLPERFVPFDIGDDWILGRELDDLDVEHVRLYRIARQ